MQDFLKVSKALADEQRARLLLALEGRELCVCHLTELLCLAPSTVSRHLSILRSAGLVQSRKHGTWVHYRLATKAAGSNAWVGAALQWACQGLATNPVVVRDRTRLVKILAQADDAPCCDETRPRLLFLCRGNSSRSQMAEGWARTLKGDLAEIHSAGTEAFGLDHRAVTVMKEVGIDISRYKSQSLEAIQHLKFDLVMVLRGQAEEFTGQLPAAVSSTTLVCDDPVKLVTPDEGHCLDQYRLVRDRIRDHVEGLHVPGAPA